MAGFPEPPKNPIFFLSEEELTFISLKVNMYKKEEFFFF